jgi:hypothetical protein
MVLAARDGVRLAQSSGYEKIVLELDNKELASLLRTEAGERSSIAGLWHEIKELSRSFIVFKVSLVNRECNEAANMCAKLTSTSVPEWLWSDNFPSMLVGIIETDCNPALV